LNYIFPRQLGTIKQQSEGGAPYPLPKKPRAVAREGARAVTARARAGRPPSNPNPSPARPRAHGALA
jgi:hypothetical protein